jgi:hypothetical protein
LALGYDCGIKSLFTKPVEMVSSTALHTGSVAFWAFGCSGSVKVCFPFLSAAGDCHSQHDCYSRFKTTQQSSFSSIAL